MADADDCRQALRKGKESECPTDRIASQSIRMRDPPSRTPENELQLGCRTMKGN
ncbi:hypothetical protein IEO21_09208 [Rhodonia placenta]|uniref:Uncharacterized protein n=1 Tax=Rhodonia placenta TaxID=104341 RepID=A0A8H7NUZ2_9APHY|nr:hypothetical protein IEO21_09208 [Postia placenta]